MTILLLTSAAIIAIAVLASPPRHTEAHHLAERQAMRSARRN